MRNRFTFGILLLVFLLAVCLAVNGAAMRIFSPMESMMDSAARAALAQDWETALSLAGAARNRWIQYRRFTASVADQSPMDDTERLFAEMDVYARFRDREHFSAACAELSIMCQAMGDAHNGTWWNLL